ncbi:helix-turn-helix domain-containing protein [Ascidiimonas sp. W6]|uniref:helix-turn-helix domain-containing protein n=1 Tax=Ascidiimonas meishanensis TaxID=3128903 RepID=UPI0030ED181E
MTHEFKEFSTGALLTVGDENLLSTFKIPKQTGLYMFLWARMKPVSIIVDSVPITLDKDEIMSLTPIQYLQYQEGTDLLVYQFNREFYCIKDHDKEVSCAGLLFYGDNALPVMKLSKKEVESFNLLHQVFLEELQTEDTIQAEMLRMLMARFMIKSTRILKQQHENNNNTILDTKTETLRTYNFLVENHFKESHSVAFYAEKMFKSPKTLSNSFTSTGKTPIQIIHDRIVLEAKRLLYYTDKSSKEIAYELGFEDASHLSRIFKKQTGITPGAFKKQQQSA